MLVTITLWAVVALIILQAIALWNTIGHGRYTAKVRCTSQTYGFTVSRNRHSRAAKFLVWVTRIFITTVLLLEFEIRASTMYIAPINTLLLVHLPFALTFWITLEYMYASTGDKKPEVHRFLGKRVLVISYTGMLGTGAMLLLKVL